MTGLERALAALRGEAPDRRAFTLTLSLYGARLASIPLSEYYTDPRRYLEGQIAIEKTIGPDILFSPFALALEGAAFGSELVCMNKNPPNVRKPAITSTSDLGKLFVPDIRKDPGLSYLIDSMKLLAEHFNKEVALCAVLTSPIDLPVIIMGVDNWLDLVLFDRPRAEKVISMMTEYFLSISGALFEAGADFIALPMILTNPHVVFPRLITEFIVPESAKIFEKVKGPIIFHHGGNPLAANLGAYSSLPNVVGYTLDSHDSFATARSIIGPKPLLLGNLDGPTLAVRTPQTAISRATSILEDRKDDRSFIFSTSAADIGWDTPLETLTGIRDAVNGYAPL